MQERRQSCGPRLHIPRASWSALSLPHESEPIKRTLSGGGVDGVNGFKGMKRVSSGALTGPKSEMIVKEVSRST